MRGLKAVPVLLSVLLVCSALFFLPYAAGAEGPLSATHEFQGTVSNNGKVVGAGYNVTAVVNGQEMAAATTDAQGKWGISQPFIVAAPAGSIIEFYVNGDLAGSAASCIQTNQLNLTVSGAPPPSVPTSSVASPAASAVSGTVGNQATLSSTISEAPSSSSTITFYIDPQPSSARTSPAATVIKCSLPGQQDSLTLSNGVLSSQKELDSAGGAVELDFAASTTTNLIAGQQLTVEPAASAPAAPAGSEIVAAYSFEPENSTFTPPITLKLKYDRDKLPVGMEEASLYIAQLVQPGEWMALPSTIDKNDNKVSGQISHFSVYGLLGRLTPVSSVITQTAHDSEVVPPPVQSPIAESSLQEGGTSPAPTGAGTVAQTSLMDALVLGVLVAGGILIIILLLSIIKRSQRY